MANKFEDVIQFLKSLDRAEVDPDKTMVSAYRLFLEAKELVKGVDLDRLMRISEIGVKLREAELAGKIVTRQIRDAVDPKAMEEAYEHWRTPSSPLEKNFLRDEGGETVVYKDGEPVGKLDEDRRMVPLDEISVPVEITPVEDTPAEEEPESESEPEKADDVEWIQITWLPNIPTDKYEISSRGKVRNSRNKGPILPFMRNGALCVRLTGIVRPGKKNACQLVVPIVELAKYVVDVIKGGKEPPKPVEKPRNKDGEIIRKTPSGRYRLEDLSVPMKPLAPPVPVDDEPEVSEDGYPEFAKLDFLPTILPDKYIIYKDGRVKNTKTDRILAIKDRHNGYGRYCLLGDCSRVYRTIPWLLIVAFSQDRQKAIGILNNNQKPKLLDPAGPICLDNIDMNYYR